MKQEDKAWLLAVAYAATDRPDLTTEDFYSKVCESEVDFLNIFKKQEDKSTRHTIEQLKKLSS